jgi:hypothetical protein
VTDRSKELDARPARPAWQCQGRRNDGAGHWQIPRCDKIQFHRQPGGCVLQHDQNDAQGPWNARSYRFAGAEGFSRCLQNHWGYYAGRLGPAAYRVDTLLLARRKYPGGSNRLDDLCQRFGIDSSRRTKHGALLDAELQAEVYLELIGARQAQLGLVFASLAPATVTQSAQTPRVRPFALAQRLTDAERAAHRILIATLGAKVIWNEYQRETARAVLE